MNREGRRISEKAKKAKRYKVTLVPEQTDLISQEDDLGLWTETLEGYRKMAISAQSRLMLGLVFRNGGIPDPLAKDWFYADSSELAKAAAHTIHDMLSPNRSLFNSFIREVVTSRNSGNRYTDAEQVELWQLIRDADISTLDVLREIYRHTQGMRELTKMHVDWLKAQKKNQKKDQKKQKGIGPLKPDLNEKPNPDILNQSDEQIELTSPDSFPVTLPDESEEFLPGISLFWTTRPWESDEKYLNPIDTSTRSQAVTGISQEVRGYASIKPGSVANALEFYTRQEVLQKALAARLRYVPDDLKDWARIKRGKDRIALKELITDEGQRRIVFFVEGRDQIYRSLDR